MLIDFVAGVPGECLAETSKFIKSPGGAPANVVVAISKLGGSSAFIGKYGNDEFGEMLVEILKRNGVKQEGICLEPEARTGLTFVSFKKNGERDFIFYGSSSAGMLLKESEVNMDLIRSAKTFHFGSICLVSEPCKGAHMAAIKAAKDIGLLLSYNPNVRISLWPSPQAARQGINNIWNQAHIIKVSDEELAFLTERDPYLDDSAMSLWFDGLKLLVVTYGYKGCGYFTKIPRTRL